MVLSRSFVLGRPHSPALNKGEQPEAVPFSPPISVHASVLALGPFPSVLLLTEMVKGGSIGRQNRNGERDGYGPGSGDFPAVGQHLSPLRIRFVG
jgi:hypothetical protein